jgi:hydrogenase expression/formation protein HypE
MTQEFDFNGSFACPTSFIRQEEGITLAHGEGARLTRQLIRDRIVSRFSNSYLNPLGDAALLPVNSSQIAFTSDGYTVTPLFFPGGDIGRLAVYGTINDLAVMGAVPKWISLAVIVETGLSWAIFDRVLDSIQSAAKDADVAVVTGDTKVVPHGACDGLFITTSGIGEIRTPIPPGPGSLRPGDVLIVSGPIGCHGAAIISVRDELGFDPLPISDCASVAEPLIELYRAGRVPRAVRDATRGGVAAVLHEWTDACSLSCVINEAAIPVNPEVRAVCELLGLEALHLPNEGTFVLAADPSLVTSTLELLGRFDVTRRATVIGEIIPRRIAPVAVRRMSGLEAALEDPAGAPLPRIC